MGAHVGWLLVLKEEEAIENVKEKGQDKMLMKAFQVVLRSQLYVAVCLSDLQDMDKGL